MKLAAETYRDNPDFDIETAIREVGVGEAVTSVLQEKGVPGMAQRTLIRPPASQLGRFLMRNARMFWRARIWRGNTTLRWIGARPLRS